MRNILKIRQRDENIAELQDQIKEQTEVEQAKINEIQAKKQAINNEYEVKKQ